MLGRGKPASGNGRGCPPRWSPSSPLQGLHAAVVEADECRSEAVARQEAPVSQLAEQVLPLRDAAELCIHGAVGSGLLVGNLQPLRAWLADILLPCLP